MGVLRSGSPAPFVAALALACGCSEGPGFERSAAPAEPPKPIAISLNVEAGDLAKSADSAASPGEVDADGARAPAQALLAFAYDVDIELPSAKLRAVMAGHEEACRAAGLAVCQILNARVSDNGPDRVYGSLNLRAEPKWLEGFRAGLSGSAREAGGRITSESASAEDLTRQILDVEARLKAKRTLRDRLQAMLETKQGDVGELLEVERELARVVGDIDASTAQLAYMRQRVDMSALDVSYASAPVALSGGAWGPIKAAVNDFAQAAASAVAFIIYTVAYAAPFVLVLGPMVWLIMRGRRRAKAKRAAQDA